MEREATAIVRGAVNREVTALQTVEALAQRNRKAKAVLPRNLTLTAASLIVPKASLEMAE